MMTGRPIWRQMTKFWGTLFGINFVLGVATGLTMEFQFGMNWSYYSHYVGDIFGAPLAIEGPDGLLPRSDLRRALLLRLGQAFKSRPSHGNLGRRSGFQFLGALDPDRQRLDAEPGRVGVQSGDHADGGHRLLRRAFQSGRAGQVRAYRFGRLRHGLRIRPRCFGLVHVKGRHTSILPAAR